MTIATLPTPSKTTAPALKLTGKTAPVRILHVLPTLTEGGMEWATVKLIRAFAQRDACDDNDYETEHAVCVMQECEPPLLSACRELVPTWVLGDRPEQKTARRRWMRKPLRQVIDDLSPDIVHARSTGIWFDAATALLGRRDIRLLLSFHGMAQQSPLSWRRRQMNRWATRRADAVLAVSHEAAHMIHREWNVPENKIYTVPNGVDIDRFYPADDQTRRRLRRALDLDEDSHVVVCVAGLLPIKAIDVLLEAWRKVSMIDPTACLLLVGDGPLREELSLLAKRLRCNATVRFLGSRRDVPELLQAADLCVLTSRYECSSNATLEAMASAVPVVAFDVGGMHELIEPNRTGWLVPFDQPHQFAETMAAVLMDRTGRQRVGQAARQTVVEHYSSRHWVERYSMVYHDIADCR